MQIGIAGLPGSGKTTCFRVLTGHTGADTHHGTHLATVPVPDRRLDRVFQLARPKKMTYADVTFVDFEAVRRGQATSGELALHKVIGDVDALALVVQAFGALDHAGEPLDPAADLETVLLEMALSDLKTVEKRLERLAGEPKAQRNPLEMDLLQRCRHHLSSGGALRQMAMSEEERKRLRGYAPLTLMPILVVLNVGEDDLEGAGVGGARRVAAEASLPSVTLCAELELEISQLAPDEQTAFLADYGLAEPARDRLLHAAFEVLDTITFFTVNESEARSWLIRRGATAYEAAGKIHTDIQAGFVRAEVTPLKWLDQLGSFQACKERGYTRVEGRDYVIHDADIIQIRFTR